VKLYDSVGPNPHVVRMVLAEKGLPYEKQRVDLRGGENRREPYLQLNPMGQLPALELDDGTRLAEITAIAEYLDEIQPEPPLLGTNPVERGVTRMWVRRIDLTIIEPMTQGFRFSDGLPLFKDRMRCIPEAAPALKEIAREKLAWLDGHMAGHTYIVGDRFTLADVMLYCFTNFGGKVGQALDPAWSNLAAWYARVAARPSAAA
jgi:glutathione S-transferase